MNKTLTLRLLILLLTLPCVANSQSVLKVQVTLSKQSASVGEFLAELNSKPGIEISFSSVVIDLSKSVQLSGHEKNIEDHLISILRAQPVRFIEQSGKIFLVPDRPIKRKVTISGYISDTESGERLIGASVYFPGLSAGTTSNAYGFYSITLDQDSVEMQTTYAGYFPGLKTFQLTVDTVLDVSLGRNVMINEIVVVNDEGKNNAQNRTITGKTTVSPALIRSVSAMFGEADVLKTLQLLPGIQAGNEGTAGLNIRGGGADQNLILLDGVPVYNATHAFGLFSVFNADAVNNIEVLKSGFPASYGGRLSSVIDVHMKEGDKNNFHGEGGIGLVFSKLTLEGPLKKGKSSFLLSARRTYADLFIRPVLKLSESDTDVIPFFTDINAKVNFPAGEKDRIYVSLYMGQDKFRLNDKSDDSKYAAGFSWGNTTAMARWNHVFNKRTFSNFTFTYSRYRFNTFESEEQTDSDPAFVYRSSHAYFSGIRDLCVKGDIDILPSPNHFVKGGFAFTLHRYHPGISRYYEKDSFNILSSTTGNASLDSREYDLYIEDDIKLTSRLKANAGVRLSAFSLNGKTFSAVQPRLNWLYKLNSQWTFKASYGSMTQFIHLLTNSTMGLPTDLWVPVTERVPPQASHQITAGTSYNHDKSLEFSMELYYKTMSNAIDHGDRYGFNSTTYNWEDILEIGKGKAYGVEWLVQKRKGRVTGVASYTLSRSERQFDNINEGKTFPFRYDRRHELKTAVVWQPSSRFEGSANWVISSGSAYTLPSSYYYDPYTQSYIDVFESRNNSRMPAYHRLDISLKFIKQKRKYRRTWVVSVYNVYNRFNPFFRYKTYEQPGNKVVYEDAAVFPFLPSISYQFKF